MRKWFCKYFGVFPRLNYRCKAIIKGASYKIGIGYSITIIKRVQLVQGKLQFLDTLGI